MTDQTYKLVVTPDALRKFRKRITGHALTVGEKAEVLIMLDRCTDEMGRLLAMQRFYDPIDRGVSLPERNVWNQATGRDGKNFTDGWNACLDAIAAAPEPVCKWTKRGTRPWLYAHDGQHVYDGLQPEPYNYCPHCGKKVEMVGDEA